MQIKTANGEWVSLDTLTAGRGFSLFLFRETVGCGLNDCFIFAIRKEGKRKNYETVGAFIAYKRKTPLYEILIGDLNEYDFKCPLPELTDTAQDIESALAKIQSLIVSGLA